VRVALVERESGQILPEPQFKGLAAAGAVNILGQELLAALAVVGQMRVTEPLF